jgi:intracellular sulfur oxidation DsrE/DsrF family protein
MRTTPLAVLALLALPNAALAAKPTAAPPALNPDDPSSIQVRDDIKVVFHVTEDVWKKGTPETLFYVDRLVQIAYPEKLGVPTENLDFKVVAHDTPVYWFLNDAAWKASKHKSGAVPQDHNPVKDLIAGLLSAGVDIEVCAHTMEQQGYTPEMLLPGIKIAPAGLPRVIDLQLMGYERISLE